MKNLLIRSISGIIFVLVVIGLLIVHETGMFLLFLLINVLALIEFYNLSYKSNILPYKLPGILSGVFIYSLAYMAAASIMQIKFLTLVILIIPTLGVIPLFYKASTVFRAWGPTLLGIVYISIPLSLIPFMSFETGIYRFELPLGIFILIWLFDSFAYLTGSKLGRTRMLPAVSPKKTWEGAFGGLIFAIGGSVVLANFFEILPLTHWIILAILISATGTLGDLLESALKRNVGVKDSGSLMPGHGGVLDRFDSFLFSVPFVFSYLYLVVF